MINAGGKYVDRPVVRDGNIITSRLPSDLPVFCREIVRYLEDAPTRRNALRRCAGRRTAARDRRLRETCEAGDDAGR